MFKIAFQTNRQQNNIFRHCYFSHTHTNLFITSSSKNVISESPLIAWRHDIIKRPEGHHTILCRLVLKHACAAAQLAALAFYVRAPPPAWRFHSDSVHDKNKRRTLHIRRRWAFLLRISLQLLFSDFSVLDIMNCYPQVDFIAISFPASGQATFSDRALVFRLMRIFLECIC